MEVIKYRKKVQSMQNYYYQPNRFQPQQNILQQPITLKGRPVSGIEEVRAAMFSYNVDINIDQEELIADLIATYGSEIIDVTNRIFGKIKLQEQA